MGEFDYSKELEKVLKDFCLKSEEIKDCFDVLVIVREKEGKIGHTGNHGGIKASLILLDTVKERVLRHYD